MTQEQILKNDHISVDEIKKDFADTEREIKDFEDENDILLKNPQQNKVRIYFNEGRIKQRKDFINELRQIIEYREKNL